MKSGIRSSECKEEWKWECKSHYYQSKLFDILNMSLSTKTTVIGGSSLSILIGLINSMLIVGALYHWEVLTKAPASISFGHFDGKIWSKSTWHSGVWCKSATTLNRNSFSKLIFGDGKKVPTRTSANTRFAHCIGGIKSFKKVIKSLLFFLSNGLDDPLCLKFLKL